MLEMLKMDPMKLGASKSLFSQLIINYKITKIVLNILLKK